jgi:hypothetical protein
LATDHRPPNRSQPKSVEASKTAKAPSFSADMTMNSPPVEKTTWRSGAGSEMLTSGWKSETTSHSPAFPPKALRTFSVVVMMRALGPAAASKPGLEATARRVADAGGMRSDGHDSRSLSFLAPSEPCARARKPKCYTSVSHVQSIEAQAHWGATSVSKSSISPPTSIVGAPADIIYSGRGSGACGLVGSSPAMAWCGSVFRRAHRG